MMNTPAFTKGYKAAIAQKSREANPYNGGELRDEWFAGYDKWANRGGVAA